MRFVSVAHMRDWIRDTGVETIITDLVDDLEDDFRRWESFERQPRIASHSSIGVIEVMPTSDGVNYGFKYVNGHPSNPVRGLQTVTAFGVLADVMTGYPTFISEMTLLTALRTAAVSGLATRHLARADATVHGMIGAGSQAVFQAIAVRSQRPAARTVRLFDVDDAASKTTARHLRSLGFEVTVEASARLAVRDADVITTCTADKANAVVLVEADVPAGAHINAIGGDCPGKTELDLAIVRHNRVFVEHEPQTRIEGEIQLLPADFPVTELWQVIRGEAPGRLDTEITVFDSVGFAIEDFTALRYVQRATAASRYSEPIDLITEPEDPKDLYGMVGAPVLV
ncbi:ornithine cyclodeaminase [Microbacterium sp. 179-I 3D4 NHS]|uniref:ornithine cyclodeaminase n=1 Tax=Microbacterium sp. 179-I 3D4 NHS TaxID=3142381 RepID=UPI0039A06DAC